MEGKVAILCSHLEDLPMKEIDPSKWDWMHPPPRRLPKQRHRRASRRYVATFAPSKQLGMQAEAAAHTLSSHPLPPVVVVADGASWIKKEQQRHFQEATCILDWAHLWREVSHAIRAAAREKELSAAARDAQLCLHRSFLWKGQVAASVAVLEPLAAGLAGPAAKAIKEAITYLKNQKPWIVVEADGLGLARVHETMGSYHLAGLLQFPVQLQHELVHAPDPLRRPSRERLAQTPEHHDHVLHFISFRFPFRDECPGRALTPWSKRSPDSRHPRQDFSQPRRTIPLCSSQCMPMDKISLEKTAERAVSSRLCMIASSH
ncbi:MAG TPA: hypothetical protein VKR06_10365 [Ktedonosporobacter sp.]|nr:hypothetical protein [Ktedonosporobacter sp.]